MFRRVAIIGGGAGGATLLSELLERPTPQPLHLDWYTGGGTPGRGIAYGTRSERHLLNVRAASMGMFANRPSGFLEYMQKRDPNISGTDFLPRCWYGEYLETETVAALARAKSNGHDVRVIPYAVDAMVPENDGVTIFQGETTTRVEAAVLALGTLPPRPLPQVHDAVLASGRYVTQPWSLLAEAKPDTQAHHVVVIGLGLTAVDVIIELAALWPNARFTAISRHGRLPEVHQASASLPFEDGDELIETMRDAPDIRTWMHLLRDAIEHTDDWRRVIDCLRPHTQALWQLLPHGDRGRFLRHARSIWERSRHRLPLQIAQSITALEQEGRLQRLSGHLHSVMLGEHGPRIQYLPRLESQERVLDADLVVQSIGLDNDIRGTQHTLLQQLITNGHIRPDPFGLGIQAAPDGRLLHDGNAWPRFYAIGSMLRGTLWESTAMPEIRQQARQLAERWLAE
ncbi:FAD/NAD(P)-binding protein [Dyella nitratireducens]|uniref:Pyridine nucleotide-disulfide oxidoreductase n=1 Tax=Dyella nitratireducens TaxID=1849580 RepID=A0ABQ1FP35_9GAMM|nr:FAD/NAD(P)-binding protein [Dyella nitratireducens]GGA24599.1 pyridine nucleotide-disulfide oxidoreductase [Dyella nitratireducens]GLQ43802.1 pyridine nucleotide-disulfide oxidoreductase [Dyella nitratireducens]